MKVFKHKYSLGSTRFTNRSANVVSNSSAKKIEPEVMKTWLTGLWSNVSNRLTTSSCASPEHALRL